MLHISAERTCGFCLLEREYQPNNHVMCLLCERLPAKFVLSQQICLALFVASPLYEIGLCFFFFGCRKCQKLNYSFLLKVFSTKLCHKKSVSSFHQNYVTIITLRECTRFCWSYWLIFIMVFTCSIFIMVFIVCCTKLH